MTIRGVLLDAGGVLIRPVGGRWNPRYDFESVVLRHCPSVQPTGFAEAFAVGQAFLDSAPRTAALADYHRTMLRVLGVEEPGAALLTELEAPAAGPVVEPYPEVPATLAALRAAGLGLAVVSDAWAGLDRILDDLGLGPFAGVVISEVLGCRKPDPRMYEAGRAALDLPPGECLFVDDDPELVDAAVALGYRGVALARDGRPPAGTPWVPGLDALLPLVA